MQHILTDDAFDALVRDADAATGEAARALGVEMAWHQRQRATPAALARLDALEAAAPLAGTLAARAALVRGEAAWLGLELDRADRLAAAARAAFAQAGEAAGLCYALLLQATLLHERADYPARNARFAEAERAAANAGDALRSDMAQAHLAFLQGFGHYDEAVQRWGAFLESRRDSPLLPVRGLVLAALGILAAMSGQVRLAIENNTAAADLFARTGQRRQLITALDNIGNAFVSLNDNQTGLQWVDRALALARECGWPRMLAQSLLQAGDTLRTMGKLDAAYPLLQEAEAIVASRPMSPHTVMMMLGYCAHAEIDYGRYDAALARLHELDRMAIALQAAQLRVGSLTAQADAYTRSGDPAAALRAGEASLAVAREHQNGEWTFRSLLALAKVHAAHPQPPVPGSAWPNAALHHLHAALDAAAGIEGFTPPSAFFRELAAQHAAAGDHALAYRYLLQAGEAHERELGEIASNRAVALEVQHRTEHARAQAEHHAQLAQSEARRAELLERSSRVLERLGTIGQEITAQLSAEHVFAALDRHLNALVSADVLSIYVLDEGGSRLDRVVGSELGQPLPARSVALADGESRSAQCARSRQPFVLHDHPGQPPQIRTVPGTRPVLSAAFYPLIAGERLLGVLTVQSFGPDAYGPGEQTILRSLCAYGAIALDNARAYGRLAAAMQALHEAQGDLVDKNAELERANASLAESSLTDPLTGLRNRRYVQQQLQCDVALCLRAYADARSGRPAQADLAFVLIDLDHFKRVNDAHGHAAGDSVLAQLRGRLQAACREGDYLVRWGGEEILVVARQTDRAVAPALAERLRQAIGSRPFDTDAGPLTLSASLGLACFPFFAGQPACLGWEQVVELADQALYAAKRAGRDRAMAAAEAPGAEQPAGGGDPQVARLLAGGAAVLLPATQWAPPPAG